MTRKTERKPKAAPVPPFVESDLVAEIHRFPPVFFLEQQADAVMQVLVSGRRNPVLIGPRGVGKTAIVRAVATRIAEGQRPLGASAVWKVSIRTMDLLSHKDVGLVQALVQLVQAAAAHPSRPILWIPDIHLVRAFDIHSALALALDRTGIKLIGESPSTFERLVLEDAEMLSWVHPMRITASSEETSAKLLGEYRLWAKTKGLVIRKATVDAVMVEANKLFPTRALPGRMFDAFGLTLERAVFTSPVEPSLVSLALSEVLEPVPALRPPSATSDAELLTSLDELVLGMQDAKTVLVDRLSLWQRGIASREKPVATVLLAGPPGVGKSQLARAFAAKTLGRASRAVHLSCADLSDEWRVDQLLGHRAANPPEVRRGTLSRLLASEPFSLLIIEEIERAHPALHRWLQRVIDAGFYFDGHDEEVSLRRTMIILSTNAGADAFRVEPLGVGAAPSVEERMRDLLKSLRVVLPPELLDRMDHVVSCAPLDSAERMALLQRWALQLGQTIEVADPLVQQVLAQTRDTRSLRARFEREVLLPMIRRT